MTAAPASPATPVKAAVQAPVAGSPAPVAPATPKQDISVQTATQGKIATPSVVVGKRDAYIASPAKLEPTLEQRIANLTKENLALQQEVARLKTQETAYATMVKAREVNELLKKVHTDIGTVKKDYENTLFNGKPEDVKRKDELAALTVQASALLAEFKKLTEAFTEKSYAENLQQNLANFEEFRKNANNDKIQILQLSLVDWLASAEKVCGELNDYSTFVNKLKGDLEAKVPDPKTATLEMITDFNKRVEEADNKEKALQASDLSKLMDRWNQAADRTATPSLAEFLKTLLVSKEESELAVEQVKGFQLQETATAQKWREYTSNTWNKAWFTKFTATTLLENFKTAVNYVTPLDYLKSELKTLPQDAWAFRGKGEFNKTEHDQALKDFEAKFKLLLAAGQAVFTSVTDKIAEITKQVEEDQKLTTKAAEMKTLLVNTYYTQTKADEQWNSAHNFRTGQLNQTKIQLRKLTEEIATIFGTVGYALDLLQDMSVNGGESYKSLLVTYLKSKKFQEMAKDASKITDLDKNWSADPLLKPLKAMIDAAASKAPAPAPVPAPVPAPSAAASAPAQVPAAPAAAPAPAANSSPKKDEAPATVAKP